jgi:hypothetical protein|tara:strand:+ start:72 stop:353 length:282 start_codon:yes stop_codon:yes gene_type:complete
MNDVLEELFKVIDSFQTNIEDEPDYVNYIKEGHIEVLTHDNVLFELDVKKNKDGTVEKSISVSKLNDDGEVIEVFDGEEEYITELMSNSKLLN